MYSTFKPLWNVIYFSAIFWNKILNKKFASIICAIIYSYMTRKEILYYRLTTWTPKLNLYNKPKTRQKGISSQNFKLHWFQNNLIQVNKSYDFVFLYSCILIALTRKNPWKSFGIILMALSRFDIQPCVYEFPTSYVRDSKCNKRKWIAFNLPYPT